MNAVGEQSASGFLTRLTQFARLLRDNGFIAYPVDTADAATLFATQDEGRPTERRLRTVLKALYCTRRSELERFDELFDAYWNDRVGRKRTLLRDVQSGGSAAAIVAKTSGDGRPQGGLADYFEWADAGADGQSATDDDDDAESRLGGASGAQALSSMDFGKLIDQDQAEQLLGLAERIGARMRYRLSRRRKDSVAGRFLNFRRTFQRSIATAGTPMRLIRRVRRRPPVKLAVFIDVSGSMDAYSIFFTRFVHALTGRFAHAEAFLFHTKLVHITGVLREADPVKMTEKMSLISQGWSGGTRIGEALETFNANYADAFAGSRTIALIMSDGYDAGDPERLCAALQDLKRRTYKTLWLNPMLGRKGYAPETKAMAAALPYLDLFAPAHNLASLLDLEDALVYA